jgi:hypothetical protein
MQAALAAREIIGLGDLLENEQDHHAICPSILWQIENNLNTKNSGNALYLDKRESPKLDSPHLQSRITFMMAFMIIILFPVLTLTLLPRAGIK